MALSLIPVIPALVIPTVTPPYKFLGSLTGTGPWDFTGLNGDATGLVGYEVRYLFFKSGTAAFEVGMRFNADSGAAKYANSATTSSSIIVGGGAGGGAGNQTLSGVLRVGIAASGNYRVVDVPNMVADDTPQVSLYSSARAAWFDTSAITQVNFLMRSGTITSSIVKLYAVMDVT